MTTPPHSNDVPRTILAATKDDVDTATVVYEDEDGVPYFDFSSTAAPEFSFATMTDVKAVGDSNYEFGVTVDSQPGATDRDKLIAALATASTRGQGGVVLLPDRRIDVGVGLSLAGYSCGIIGRGASRGSATEKSTIVASQQDGPVLDFTGFRWPPGYRGRIQFEGFTVEGSGIADPTKLNVGINLGRTPGPGAVTWRDIMVWKTGGECIIGTYVYLHDFESINLVSPYGARDNDVPYMRLIASNGNDININFYEEGTATNGSGVSGVLVLESSEQYYCSKNRLNIRTENVAMPSNGTMLNICGGNNIIDHRDWDSRQDPGTLEDPTVNTSFIRLAADPMGVARGGNQVIGYIPGYNTTSNRTCTWGVDVQENGARIIGTKSYKGGNVRLAPGVERVYVELGGSRSNADDPAFVDESGSRNNTLIDHVLGYQNIQGVVIKYHQELSTSWLQFSEQLWPERGQIRFGKGVFIIQGTDDLGIITAPNLVLGDGGGESGVRNRYQIQGKQMFFPAVTELPSAAAGNHRSMVLLSVDGQDDQMMMCLRRADGSYYWKEL